MAQKPQNDLTKSEWKLTEPAETRVNPATKRCIILVLDGANTLTFGAAVDPLRAANRQSGRTLYEWQFATPRDAPITLTSGVSLPAAPIQRLSGCDLLIVVAGFELEAQSTPALRASLRRLAAGAQHVLGIDGGPWVMARAGLLDGHEATTHWEDLEKFGHTFPSLTVINARFHQSGNRLTCAGAAPAIEMMLHLIGSAHGPGLAAKVAGGFILDPAPSGHRPQRRIATARHNRITSRAQSLMEQSLDTPLGQDELARQLGLSPRALQQQFRARLNTSPAAHYRALRLAEAERLIRQTDMPLQEIALATGFGAQSSLTRAFRSAFGTAPSAARRAAPEAPQ